MNTYLAETRRDWKIMKFKSEYFFVLFCILVFLFTISGPYFISWEEATLWSFGFYFLVFFPVLYDIARTKKKE